MAISVGKNMTELKKMAQDIGIDWEKVPPSGKNGRLMKEDLIWPIREKMIAKRYGGVEYTPEHLNLMLKIKSPMLAIRMDELKTEQQDEIWSSDEWGFEQKFNGVRVYLVCDGNSLRVYSRHNSDIDLLPIDFTSRILFPDHFDLDHIVRHKFIIDCEMISDVKNLNTVIEKYGVVTETELQAVTALLSSDISRAMTIQKQENFRLKFCSFDCVYYEGQWLFQEQLSQRKGLARELINELKAAGFKIEEVPYVTKNKREFYHQIISRGDEGCVAKRTNGIYIPDTIRGFKGWVKIKRSMSQAASMDNSFGDTIDGWIGGATAGEKGSAFEGLIGAIRVYVYLNTIDGRQIEHEIARVSGLDLKLRQDMTEMVDGIPTLNPKYFGRVVEIDGAAVSARERRLQHAVLCGFRYEKDRGSCVMEEAFLNKMIL